MAPEVWPAPPRRSAESHRIGACIEQQNFKRALKKPPVGSVTNFPGFLRTERAASPPPRATIYAHTCLRGDPPGAIFSFSLPDEATAECQYRSENQSARRYTPAIRRHVVGQRSRARARHALAVIYAARGTYGTLHFSI